MTPKKIFIFSLLFVSFLFAEDSRFSEARTLFEAGSYEKALEIYRALTRDAGSSVETKSEAYFLAGETYVKLKKYDRALANYQLAYNLTKTMTKAYEGSAKVYELLGAKEKAEAERLKDPKNKKEEIVAETQAVEAPAIVPEEPQNQEVLQPKKEEPKQETLQKKEEKVAEVQKVKKEESVKRVSIYESELFKKGVALFQAKKYEEAAPVWRDILKQEPGNPGAYYYAGVGRYELGALDKAEYNLKRSFDYPELGFNAHYYLSLIYKKQNKKELEKEELKKYIQKTKNQEAKKKAEARILELKNAEKPETKKQEQKSVEKTELVKKEEKVAEKSQEIKKELVAEPLKQEALPVKEFEEQVPSTKEETAQEKALSLEETNILFGNRDFSGALKGYKELLESNTLNEEDKAFVLLQLGNIYRERRDFRSAVLKYREVVEEYSNVIWAEQAEKALKDAVWLEKNIGQFPRNK